MADEPQAPPATPETPPAPIPVPPVAPTPEPVAPVVEAEAPAVDISAELEAMRKKTAELEAALTKERGDTRSLAFSAAFDRAGVAPAYRDYLRAQLGDVDPRSEAGLTAIDKAAKAHPAMLVAHVSTADPMAEYLRAKVEEAKKSGATSMWSQIPADMMREMAAAVDR